VVEEMWGCQFIVGNDRHDDPRLLDNVESLMRQAHAFIAEITEANANVMFELGAAYNDRHNRPFVLLRHSRSAPPLSADIRSLLYVDYDVEDVALDARLEREMRKNKEIDNLVKADRARYLPPASLTKVLGIELPGLTVERLAARYPTSEDWATADETTVADILGEEDRDFARAILNRIQRGRR
jgi:hypothetical protein